MASTSPPRFDFWDLKNDVNAGIVCWNLGDVTGGGEPAALGCEELEVGAVGLEEVEEVDYLG
jgi:hypothetical protein